MPPYAIEFYEDDRGHVPALVFINGSGGAQRRAIGVRINECVAFVLQRLLDVADSGEVPVLEGRESEGGALVDDSRPLFQKIVCAGEETA